MAGINPLEDLQAYAEAAIKEHDIPALSLAIWHKGKLHKAAAGILNINTGVEATTDSIFQIGSITKVMTASLVMRLVDQGKVDLDLPVKHYLRDFQLADAKAAAKITVRQLLNHTNGIAGDYFPDDEGHSGNLIARFVDRCSLLPVIHPIGKMHSYSNSAFGIAGRLIEVVSGKSWCQAMNEDLFQPLGMTQAIADPKDMIRYRVAVGHALGHENAWEIPDKNYLTLGQAPCGSTTAMTAADVITFARAHISQETNKQNNQQWLSAGAISAMQTATFEKPQLSDISKSFAGLGWAIKHYAKPALTVLSHSGAVCGSKSMLQIIPKLDIAFAVLINGHHASAISSITQDHLQALAGINNREPQISAANADLARDTLVTGFYQSFDSDIQVRIESDRLYAQVTYNHDPIPSAKIQLTHLDGLRYAVFDKSGSARSTNLIFLNEDQAGRPQYLYMGSRLATRTPTL